ncbi:MAG: flagellar export protein FliJ [Defluviitaleaceae bacterium]|nr:flagellar export protein FliJ [Defluviitaleaceae bacterium]
MAKFIFQMESILNFKTRIAEQKEQEYAKALHNLATQRGILAGYYNDKEQTISTLKGEMGVRIAPLDFKIYTNYIEAVKKKIERQKKVITKAEEFAEKKRLELVEATKEKKMMEKLKENKYEEFMEEEKRNEQKQVDEVVSYRFKPKPA